MKLTRMMAPVVALGLLLSSSPSPAAPQGSRQERGRQFVTGQEAHDRVTQLASSIPWYTSLYQAEETARRQDKMIFWLHILGDMKGAT